MNEMQQQYTISNAAIQNAPSGDHAEYRIYVADLAQYNNGHLFGQWIDANQDAEDIQAEVEKMLAMHGGEEWAIHDYELSGVKIAEWESFENVSAIAKYLYLSEETDFGADLLEYCDNDISRATECAEGYYGEFPSVAYFAEEFASENGEEIPEQFINYIDWEAYGHDLELNGDIFTLPAGGGAVHVFFKN